MKYRTCGAILALSLAFSVSAKTGDAITAAQIAAIYPHIEQLYIDLHRNPELSYQERRTGHARWGLR